jgi:hypothetical protein
MCSSHWIVKERRVYNPKSFIVTVGEESDAVCCTYMH